MALVRWSPVGQLAGMEVERLNRMFSELYQNNFSGDWTPAVDIYQTDKHEVVIKAELPDTKREDISVTFENNVLTLKGERKLEQEVKREILPANRAPLWQLQPVLHASVDCRCLPDQRVLQGRRADGHAAAARGGPRETDLDQRRVTSGAYVA